MQLQREMAGASTTQHDGMMRVRRQEEEKERQGTSKAQTQAWNVPRVRGAACASAGACWKGRVGG